MKITEKIIPINKYNRPGTAIVPEIICIHYTGQAGAGADRLALYYKNVAAGMFPDKPDSWTSAQYIVGTSGEVIRIIPDKEMSYAASGRNNGTIHIEVCYKKQTGEFEKASIDALHELVLLLMKKYNIPTDKVVRHYDLTGKRCPAFYVDETRWAALHDLITAPAADPDTLYRVQVGAFSSRENAALYLDKVKAAGFSGFIVEVNKNA